MRRIKSVQYISEKAKKAYFRLMSEARRISDEEGHSNWNWANTFMERETINMLRDMKDFAEGFNRIDRQNIIKRQDVIAENDLKIREVVMRYIDARISTYNGE